jgi:hypothetical protein
MDSVVPDIYPQSIISWKGKTFNQITSAYRINKVDMDNEYNPDIFFNPGPVKTFRKEIASLENPACNYRVSAKIDEFDRPGGSIITSLENSNGLVNTLDFTLPNDLYMPTCLNDDTMQCGSSSTNINNCLSQQMNARRRVRSSGMIRKIFSEDGIKTDNYCTNTNQYLNSRCKTYQQNQYNFLRQGSVGSKPGDIQSGQNVYSSYSINQCPKYKLIYDASFSYQWIDGTVAAVVIPAGSYNVDDLNNILKLTMISNNHYFIENNTMTSVFLIDITFNNDTNRVEILCRAANSTMYSTTNYSKPPASLFDPVMWNGQNDEITLVPIVILPNDGVIATLIGFQYGNYPNAQINNSNGVLSESNSMYQPTNFTEDQLSISSAIPKIVNSYRQIYYKPSNYQFATQGGVSSGARIHRIKYDTITKSASNFMNAFNSGTATMNALAYGVSDQPYTTKDKMGYPIKMTPVFSKYNDDVCQKYSKFTNLP